MASRTIKNEVNVEITLDTGQTVTVSTGQTEAQRLANQLQRRLSNQEATQVRFALSEDTPGHYLVIDSARIVAIYVTPAS